MIKVQCNDDIKNNYFTTYLTSSGKRRFCKIWYNQGDMHAIVINILDMHKTHPSMYSLKCEEVYTTLKEMKDTYPEDFV